MSTALAMDFAALDGVTVDVLADESLPPMAVPGVAYRTASNYLSEWQGFDRCVRFADWTLLIAPELDGYLLERTRVAESLGANLLSPHSHLVDICADKHITAEHLAAHGVPVPNGIALARGEKLPLEFPYPGVLKRRDGAGSLGIELITDRIDNREAVTFPARLERFCSGTAASVACLCGPGKILPLVPCLQHLSDQSDFCYLGGALPIDPALAARATQLAVQAVGTLPRPRGYIGVDVVLGNAPDGSGDVVVEINPRLTTSYIGLRAHSRVNLAAAMIAVAQGHAAELCWNSTTIHFSSSGICGPSPASD